MGIEFGVCCALASAGCLALALPAAASAAVAVAAGPFEEPHEQWHDVGALVVARGFSGGKFDLWPQEWIGVERETPFDAARGRDDRPPERVGLIDVDVLADWVGARCDLEVGCDPSRPRQLRAVGTAAELSTLALSDRTALLWCGALGNYLRAWDVDTAGEAKIGTPELEPRLDGVFLTARLRSSAVDHAAFELRGVVSRPAGPVETREFDDPDGPLIQFVTFERRTIDTVLDVSLQDGVGKSALPGVPLALEVTLVRLPGR
ncbi:MAG: hypothetical protein FJ293_07530 [Planctomycetes bacterium]|nr:hypothetical protein [Planctomycetota bacterium]